MNTFVDVLHGCVTRISKSAVPQGVLDVILNGVYHVHSCSLRFRLRDAKMFNIPEVVVNHQFDCIVS